MSKLTTASLCYTDIVEKAKAGHSAFSRAKNGKVYFNIAIWENEEPDKFGNDCSLMLNSSKEKKESEGKVYIGNGKVQKSKQPESIIGENHNSPDDLPF